MAGELLEALLGTRYSAAESPWGLAAAGISQGIPHLVNPYSSTGSNLASTLGAGLLAAIFAGMAKNDASAENARILPLRAEFMSATPERQAAIVEQEPRFANLQSALFANQLENQLAANTEVAKAKALLPFELQKQAGSKFLEIAAKQGKVFDTATGKLVEMYNPAEEAAREARLVEEAKAGIQQPKQEAEKTLAAEKFALTTIKELPSFKRFDEIKANFDTLVKVSKQDSIAADITAIKSFARIGDPMSTVMAGEYSVSSDVQGLLDKLAGNWRQVVEGKSMLGPEAKAALIEAAAAKYNEMGKAFEEQKSPLLAALRKQGGDPANVNLLQFRPYETKLEVPPVPPAGYEIIGKNPATGKYQLRRIGG